MEMSYFNKIDTDEIIAMAVYSEEESYKFYLALADQVDNDFLKEKLKYFADQEKLHKKILIELNENLFGMKNVKEPSKKYPFECFIKNSNVDNIDSLLKAIEIAMNCENRAVTIYKSISTRVKDTYAKKIFLYLSNMEKQHYIALKGDYDFFKKFAGSMDEFNKKSSFIGIKFKR